MSKLSLNIISFFYNRYTYHISTWCITLFASSPDFCCHAAVHSILLSVILWSILFRLWWIFLGFLWRVQVGLISIVKSFRIKQKKINILFFFHVRFFIFSFFISYYYYTKSITNPDPGQKWIPKFNVHCETMSQCDQWTQSNRTRVSLCKAKKKKSWFKYTCISYCVQLLLNDIKLCWRHIFQFYRTLFFHKIYPTYTHIQFIQYSFSNYPQ